MRFRQLIQPGITASVLAHGLLLGLIVLFSEVHPFGTVTAEPIAVDLVTPDEVPKPSDEKQPERDKPQLQLAKDDFNEPTKQAASPPPSSPPPSTPPAEPAKQPARAAAPNRQAAASPQPRQLQPEAPPPAASTPPPSPRQQPAYIPPEPDVTVKYGVMLGLPEALPPVASSGDKPGDGIDATASSEASIASNLIARFREHLKTCARLPPGVTPSDHVFVRLRVAMTPQARLAAEPILIEGSASTKALDLKNSAVQALSACQPYDMLPADRYREWRVLDLSFTPQDLS